MKDALHTKIQLMLAVTLAFAVGLIVATGFDLTTTTLAAERQEPPDLQLGASADQLDRIGTLEFSEGFSGIASEISPAVVTIEVEQEVDPSRMGPRERFFRPFRSPDEQEEPPLVQGSGSGFIISEDGYILTNNHVVDTAEEIRVVLADRREFTNVQIVGRDPQTDVALLKIDAEGLAAAPLGSSSETRVGEWVLAIGSPGIGGGEILPSTVTAGIVSAKGRSIGILNQRLAEMNVPPLAIEDFIQTDAVINRGNSGGPLVNMSGEVIGINTALVSETGTYQGYGFAVPIGLVRQVVEDLLEHGEVRRAVLGVLIEEVGPNDARYFGLDEIAGVEVADFSNLVEGTTPAERAGIRPGDLILEVENERVSSVGDLQRKIRGYEPGDEITLGIIRRESRERENVEVTLGAAETMQTEPRETAQNDLQNPLGVQVAPLDSEWRRRLELPQEVQGVVITDVSRRGPLTRAAGSQLQYNIIADINGEPITGVEEYRERVEELEAGEVASIRLYNPNPQVRQYRFVTVPIPSD